MAKQAKVFLLARLFLALAWGNAKPSAQHPFWPDGYLILETGVWDRRIVAPTFFAFFSLSVALNRTSTTDLQTVSPHPNINPHGPPLRAPDGP